MQLNQVKLKVISRNHKDSFSTCTKPERSDTFKIAK